MRQSLSPPDAISLTNNLIIGMKVSKGLIDWKKQCSFGESGTLGVGHWTFFKK